MRTMRSLAGGLRLTLVGGFLSYRALITFLTPALFFVMMIATPLFQIITFSLLGRYSKAETADFYVVGTAIQASAMAGIYGASQAVANERAFGTLAQMLISPAARFWIMLGRLIPTCVNGIVVAVFGVFAGWALLGLRLGAGDLAPIGLAAVCASASCAGLGLVIGALGLRFSDMYFITNAVHLVLLIATGAVIPLALLPEWVRALSRLLPMSHSIAMAQDVVAGRSFSALHSVGAELLLAACYFGVALAALARSERQSRRHSTLELV
ncbi:ABC transporter permease [Streptomyces tagetis]|uniref:Transport permease protein n=1 Tax=Streptomyces tagetis TaxID=2820809 RepID=A0A940XJV5_9ACTN|nr:ABC transporter permease [Streptomyces sp. RG38]MBQ0825158.1 ABC transporter permease [Streptomyces sp. RG38]